MVFLDGRHQSATMSLLYIMSHTPREGGPPLYASLSEMPFQMQFGLR
jgi:hypothetical protein